MLDGGAFDHVIGRDLKEYTDKPRKVSETRTVQTAKGKIVLQEKRDLQIGRLEVKDAWYNEEMDTSVLSEGKLSKRNKWKMRMEEGIKTLTTPEGEDVKTVEVHNTHYIDVDNIPQTTDGHHEDEKYRRRE